MSRYFQILRILWASPATLLGLLFVPLAWASGGAVRRVEGALEVYGAVPRILLKSWPFRCWALTLGHVVLGTDERSLAFHRGHERAHVEQYGRWGLAFIPAYLACSLWLCLRGRDPYRDNPFERSAFGRDGREGGGGGGEPKADRS